MEYWLLPSGNLTVCKRARETRCLTYWTWCFLHSELLDYQRILSGQSMLCFEVKSAGYVVLDMSVYVSCMIVYGYVGLPSCYGYLLFMKGRKPITHLHILVRKLAADEPQCQVRLPVAKVFQLRHILFVTSSFLQNFRVFPNKTKSPNHFTLSIPESDDDCPTQSARLTRPGSRRIGWWTTGLIAAQVPSSFLT